MSYIPNVQAQTSEIGVNSYTATTGSLWAGNVFTGAGEQNDFNYVGVNLQTDESGTLTFEFSQDGTNWSSYPTQEFVIAGGINEVHGAWKGTRYVRPKFTGADGSRTYFRIRTMYSYAPITLSAPLNQPISSDSDANIVRAVSIGANPNGVFINDPTSGVDDNNSSASVLSGATSGFTGNWSDVSSYSSLSVLVDGTATGTTSGTLQLQFSHDSVIVNRDIQISVSDITNAPPRTLGIVAKYFRVIYTTDGDLTSFDLQTMYHKTQVQLVSRLDQTLNENDDVTNVRAVLTGQQPDGDYVNSVADGTAFSTSSLLLSGETYTSPWTDTDGFNSISVFIESDVKSEIDGVTVQFTDDVQAGVPVVRKALNYTYEQKDIDRGYLEFTFPTELDGFRLLYTNNSDNQGSFFIQSDLRVNRSSNRYNTGGALVTGDFLTEVALGFIPNNFVGTKFGTITQVDSGDPPRTVWSLADDTRTPRIDRKNFSSSADTIYVSSSDVSDSGITITTIINDSNNDLRTIETVISGQTPVSIGSSGYDCNTAFVSGNDQTLAGDVYVTLGSDHTNGIPNDLNKVLAFIPQQSQRTQQATFRVPRNTRMIIDRVHSSIGAGGSQASAVVNLRVKPENGSWYILRPYNITTSFSVEREETIVLNAGTYVEFFIDVNGSNIDSTTFFRYQLINGNL